MLFTFMCIRSQTLTSGPNVWY